MNRTVFYYNFLIGGKPAGYYELEDTGSEIFANATFEMGGQVLENKFDVRYEGVTVTGYRIGAGAWRTEGLDSPDHFPSSAYELVLRDWAGDRSYQCVREEDGAVLGETKLTGKSLAIGGFEVAEERDGITLRRFVIDGGRVLSIDWGGAISELCSNYEEATRDTRFQSES